MNEANASMVLYPLKQNCIERFLNEGPLDNFDTGITVRTLESTVHKFHLQLVRTTGSVSTTSTFVTTYSKVVVSVIFEKTSKKWYWSFCGGGHYDGPRPLVGYLASTMQTTARD